MNALLIAKRDVSASARTFSTYGVVAGVLVVTGLLFQTYALGNGAAYSHDVLAKFFEFSGGLVMISSILITMRSLAEERQRGTDVLLATSTASKWAVVMGKWLAAMTLMATLIGLTAYMPAMIFIHGKVSLAHIATGYLGLLCLAAATTAMGIFSSSIFQSQMAAGMFGGVLLVTLLLGWMLSRATLPPFSDVFAYMAFWEKHFLDFMEGRLQTRDVVYYLSITSVFLLAATQVLEGRRWQ